METIVGLFDRYSDADRAVHALEEYNVDSSRISVITRDHDKLPHRGSAAGVGAATGATAGGLVGLLAGLSALIVPGIGPILATGALATTLGTTLGLTAVGAGVGAAAGGLVGALTHAGFSAEDASLYAEGVKRGGVLVYVETGEQDSSQIRSILREAGAVDVNDRRQKWEHEGWTGYEETTETAEYGENTRPRDSSKY